MSSNFRLRCSISGHSADVRAVAAAILPDGGIVSASRDKTSRLWRPEENLPGFTEQCCFHGHSNFVICVCVVPPDSQFPMGLIVTGGNDKKINVYLPDCDSPIASLSGHENTVSTVSSIRGGVLLSGSWDSTARLWTLEDFSALTVLTGHSAAVWCAQAVNHLECLVLTGSADKTIRLWRSDQCLKTFTGHTDCVRALAVLSSEEFLSGSNDMTIRHWSVAGPCLHEHRGHTSFVYSVCLLPNGTDFASSGEDRTIRVWSRGACVQTLPLPAQSVWSVTCLQNGDIAAGGSDGIIRVFTRDLERCADPGTVAAFEAELSQTQISAKATDLGEIKVEDLPGADALHRPGKRDGQTTMIHKGNNEVEVHQWSEAETRWIKIGDVVGTGKESQAPEGGKTLFEGKEYDFVFTVDVDENKPALKIPFNVDDDPWATAQRFIEKHDLNQVYLDQIAHFIMKNVGDLQTTRAPPQPAGYVDPFTGESRYVPSSSNGLAAPKPTRAPAASVADPFTGGSAYHSASVNPYFPASSVVTFDTASLSAILGKISEFNTVERSALQLSENELQRFRSLMENETSHDSQQMDIFEKLLQWPSEFVFPVLDCLRLVIRRGDVCDYFCVKKGTTFLDYCLRFLHQEARPTNQMLVLRTLANMFVCDAGQRLALDHVERIMDHATSVWPTSNKNVQVALTSLLINFAYSLRSNLDIQLKSRLLSAFALVAMAQMDAEALFRLLVALGTICDGDEECKGLARSLDLPEFVEKIGEDPQAIKKVKECAILVKKTL